MDERAFPAYMRCGEKAREEWGTVQALPEKAAVSDGERCVI